VLGLDHYQFYALPLFDMREKVVEHLAGALAKAVFHLTEENPIELGRERSLQHGLTLDLLPHFLALLTYLGDVATIDDLRVVAAGRYTPLVARDPRGNQGDRDIGDWYRNETYSRVEFTLEDFSGNGHRVPCTAVVGKGHSRNVKYMELVGLGGNAIRLDLNRQPDPDPSPGYPWDSLFFLYRSGQPVPDGVAVIEVPDPYEPTQTLCIRASTSYRKPLERKRYQRLLNDLLDGSGGSGVAGALLLAEAQPIVQALDRIWRAIQLARPSWVDSPLNP